MALAVGSEKRASLCRLSPFLQICPQRLPDGLRKHDEVLLGILALSPHIKDSTAFLVLYVPYVGTYDLDGSQTGSDNEIYHGIVPEALLFEI